MRYFFFLTFFVVWFVHAEAQPIGEEKQVLQLVEKFLLALEKQDTAALHNMFIHQGYAYSIREVTQDSAVVRSQSPSGFSFQPGRIIKERMRTATTSVKIDGRIAMIWAPYELWVNENFSHCGVDVFTLLKTSSGWRIASIAYTVEKTGCE